MLYLIARHLKNETVEIAGNCPNPVHRGVIVRNHCIKENIIFVGKEEDIDEKCKGNETFCYELEENEYVILQCNKIFDGYVFYGYVEKEIIGFLDIVEYENESLPLSSLKIQDSKKVLNI